MIKFLGRIHECILQTSIIFIYTYIYIFLFGAFNMYRTHLNILIFYYAYSNYRKICKTSIKFLYYTNLIYSICMRSNGSITRAWKRHEINDYNDTRQSFRLYMLYMLSWPLSSILRRILSLRNRSQLNRSFRRMVVLSNR